MAVTANAALLTAVLAIAEGTDQRAERPFSAAAILTGTAHERGEEYGTLYKVDIREFLDREIAEL